MYIHISVTRWHILTHYTSNESWDPGLCTDYNNMVIHTRIIEILRIDKGSPGGALH